MKTGLEDYYVIKNNKKLRFGYTTGSSAAGAAKAAARMLFSEEPVPYVRLATPRGIELYLEILEIRKEADSVSCCVRKMAGDDPDATDGVRVFARVQKMRPEELLQQAAYLVLEEQNGITTLPAAEFSAVRPADVPNGPCSQAQGSAGLQVDLRALRETGGKEHPLVGITGGPGVGIVTLPGLEQPVGLPAINRVPRRMIGAEVLSVAESFGYTDGLLVMISVPEGEQLAEKTFNPRLGIRGGISILGTSGIVEPMSERALVASIELEMQQKLSDGREYLLVTPGNYGQEYLRGNFPFPHEEAIKCSNFVGQTIDLAVNKGVKGLLFVAHIGKFIKVAGGIMNTHSHEADARMEILAACALKAGADRELLLEVLDSTTTDEALQRLWDFPCRERTLQLVMERIEFYLNFRAQKRLKVGAIIFNNIYGELGRTSQAEELLEGLQSIKGEESI